MRSWNSLRDLRPSCKVLTYCKRMWPQVLRKPNLPMRDISRSRTSNSMLRGFFRMMRVAWSSSRPWLSTTSLLMFSSSSLTASSSNWTSPSSVSHYQMKIFRSVSGLHHVRSLGLRVKPRPSYWVAWKSVHNISSAAHSWGQRENTQENILKAETSELAISKQEVIQQHCSPL